ncbi:MAG: carbonic anhydrase [Oscillospiraceae bacterium]|nr:carbonic anhydrase [Oscillospiraceae bacterium]
MNKNIKISANDALEKLKAGNEEYINSQLNTADISSAVREKACKEGQAPYAVIISCSDSRVIPENIFMAGIGELFVIRVAGNVIGNHQLGSIEYAASHLGCKLIVVLGHTHCGAVDAAINHEPEGYIKLTTDEIRLAIGDETDDYRACCLNVNRSVSVIEESLDIKGEEHELKALGAVYHLEDGRVEFLY